MHIVDGIAYADSIGQNPSVKAVRVLDAMYMLVEFSNDEKRILDANALLVYPVYRKLLEPAVFETASVEDGVLVWLGGELDIGTHKLYNITMPYNS